MSKSTPTIRDDESSSPKGEPAPRHPNVSRMHCATRLSESASYAYYTIKDESSPPKGELTVLRKTETPRLWHGVSSHGSAFTAHLQQRRCGPPFAGPPLKSSKSKFPLLPRRTRNLTTNCVLCPAAQGGPRLRAGRGTRDEGFCFEECPLLS